MRVAIVGGGMMGLCTAMLLGNEGHDVTVLERDAHAPPDPREAFESWEQLKRQTESEPQQRRVHLLAAKKARELKLKRSK